MKLKHLTYILLPLFFAYACSSKNGKKSFDDFFNEKADINGEVIKYNTEQIGDPLSAICIKDKMFILDYYYDNFITSIDLTNFRIQHLINKGQGPEEMLHPTSLQRHGNSNSFDLYDADGKRLFIINSDSILNNSKYSPSKVSFVKSKFTNYALISLTDSAFIATGDFMNKRYRIYKDSLLISEIADYPFVNDNLFQKTLLPLIYGSILTTSPNQKYFVSACYKAPIIEFYQIVADSIKEIKKYHLFAPKMIQINTPSMESAASAADSPHGVLSITGNSSFVYILYSGRTSEKYKERCFFANTIYVFKWTGEPVIKLNVDKDIKVIAVDDMNKSLYAFGGQYGIDFFKFNITVTNKYK